VALAYEIHLAHRNLAQHPWHTAAMAMGLGLAVLVMTYIPCTLASFYDDMIDRTIEQTSAHVTVWPLERRQNLLLDALRTKLDEPAVLALTDRTTPRARDLNGWHALSAAIREVPGVVAVAGFVEGDATITSGRVNLGIVVEGIDPARHGAVVNIGKHFPDGRVPRLGPFDIAIGFRMADELRVFPGDHVFVSTPLTTRKMKVRALFRSGYYDRDLHHAFVALPTAQRMFRMGNEVSAIAARCDDLERADAVSTNIASRLDQKVRNWKDDNASLLAEVKMVQRIALFVNVLVALVATVGMANVFSMFVLNRRKELAILRAIGASRLSLRAILLIEAMFIWLVGGIVGVSLSLAVMAYEQMVPIQVSAEMYGISSYATQPKAPAFVMTAALTAGTMLFSAWRSGRSAARLSPAQVIFGR
jgi:lipoprotein-releasing system permease protein